MPNWCTNTLTVAGSADDLARFRADINPLLDANMGLCSMFPLPDSAHEEMAWTDKDGNPTTISVFSDTGYQTALDMWGSKWGDCDTEVSSEAETWVTLRYNTAWGPADRLVARLSEKYPNLVFGNAFIEEGMAVLGYLVFYRGEVVEEDDIEFVMSDQRDGEDDDDFYMRLSEETADQWDQASDACDRAVFSYMGVAR